MPDDNDDDDRVQGSIATVSFLLFSEDSRREGGLEEYCYMR